MLAMQKVTHLFSITFAEIVILKENTSQQEPKPSCSWDDEALKQ